MLTRGEHQQTVSWPFTYEETPKTGKWTGQVRERSRPNPCTYLQSTPISTRACGEWASTLSASFSYHGRGQGFATLSCKGAEQQESLAEIDTIPPPVFRHCNYWLLYQWTCPTHIQIPYVPQWLHVPASLTGFLHAHSLTLLIPSIPGSSHGPSFNSVPEKRVY